MSKDRITTSESAQRHIDSKFGDDLDAALNAMRNLAKAHQPSEYAKAITEKVECPTLILSNA